MVKTMVGGVSKGKSDDSQKQLNDKGDGTNTPKSKSPSPPQSPVRNKDSSKKVQNNSVWSCDKCHKPSDDHSAGIHWIECDLCEAKFHTKCVGISVKDYRVIDKFPTENLKWYCDNCLSTNNSAELLSGANDATSTSGSNNDNTQETIKVLASFVANNTKQLESLNKLVAGLVEQNAKVHEQYGQILQKLDNPCSEKTIQHHVEEVIVNQREKEEKKNNIILYGVVEGNKETEEENQAETLTKTKEILKYVNPEVNTSELNTERVKRIGQKKPDSKPRPVKVILDSTEDKFKLLRSARKLKDSECFKKIGLSFDKTKKEQQEYRRLKLERDEKNSATDSGKDFVIFRGRVQLQSEVTKIIKKEREGKGSGPSNRPNGGNPDGQGASKVADDKNASEAEPGPKPSY